MNKEDFIKIELQLLQTRFDKYDDLIFRMRQWFLSIYAALFGITFTAKVAELLLIAACAAILYWLFEGMLRFQHWYKYVERHRRIREALNSNPPDIESLTIYDLTNKLDTEPKEKSSRVVGSFFSPETLIFYLCMAILAIVVWGFIKYGYIPLPSTANSTLQGTC